MPQPSHILIPVLAVALIGCKPEEPKVFPQDRLTVEYSIDREAICVGDPVELIVTAYFPTNGTLKIPEIGKEKNVVLLKRDWANVPREDGLTQSESRYSITSFRLGEHVVSTNLISCRVGDQTFATNFPQVVLNVESSLPEDASSQIADIKPMQKLPGRVPPWLWISALVAVTAFLVGWITSKLWKHREHLIPSAPAIPPHVLAFRALEMLKGKGLLEKNECNPFYTELSIILRNYLEGRFSLNATDETTEEIVEEMSKSPELDGTQRNILQDFMRQTDIVKFAKGHPDRATMESAFSTTKQFVEETKLTDITIKPNT
ncbi:hypothetical protein [Pontiella sulfatireligans]|uniref:DUF4381 domain-containing protein n=1 Tax=Pontiella sulfatireligans TaxID=2750658 RepID=A0A6C2URC3_9BACT|nr:hypothetical protein [Pontiella sulfatireligans]VGO22798.1 hypothetical protein SCARR_04895 [Pontiella sulfatireligans]